MEDGLTKRQLRRLRRKERKEKIKQEKEERRNRGKKNNYLKYGAVFLLIVGAIYLFTSSGSYSNSGNVVAANINIDDAFIKGDPDAPVTIVEYGDYECPFCKRFHDTVLPQIEKEFIETGKAKYIFKDFPLVRYHPHAQKASEAALCSGNQGKFWEMHDILYNNQHRLDVNSIKGYAGNIGLDIEQFNACLDSGQMAFKVGQNAAEGRSVGVSGTPSFYINGQVFSGVLPIENWRQLIEYG